MMRLKLVVSRRLTILALVSGMSLFSVTSAPAIPYDYTVTGPLAGTFNADLSVAGGSFSSWNLTTPTTTFTNLTGATIYNANFTLFQTLGQIPSVFC